MHEKPLSFADYDDQKAYTYIIWAWTWKFFVLVFIVVNFVLQQALKSNSSEIIRSGCFSGDEYGKMALA